MISNMTCILQSLFQRHWKMLNSRNKTLESLFKKYKGPGPVTMVMLMSVLMLEI